MTVASLATITHSRPETRPTPVMMPAAGASSSYIPVAASGDSSRNGRRRIEQGIDPVPGQQLAPRHVPLPGLLGTAAPDDGEPLAQLGRQRGVDLRVALERLAGGVGLAANRR